MKNSAVLMFILATFVAGCTSAPPPYHYRPEIVYADALPPPVIANSAPPTPHEEVMGKSPVPGYIWIPGVWLWENGHYLWRDGRWMPPKPGYTWTPHRWHQVGYEWHMDGGYWLRHQ